MKRLSTMTILMTVLALASSLACASASRDKEMVKFGKDLPNFGVVAPGLYRGAAPTEAGLKKLKAMGVQTVIDLRIDPPRVKAERAEAEQAGLRFVNLPMGAEPPTKKEVATFLALSENAGKAPVYVHCQHGADRTGTMVGIYREMVDHWSFNQAYTEMRHYGFNPHWAKLRKSVEERAPAASAGR